MINVSCLKRSYKLINSGSDLVNSFVLVFPIVLLKQVDPMVCIFYVLVEVFKANYNPENILRSRVFKGGSEVKMFVCEKRWSGSQRALL